jgi:hypothetical protein
VGSCQGIYLTLYLNNGDIEGLLAPWYGDEDVFSNVLEYEYHAPEPDAPVAEPEQAKEPEPAEPEPEQAVEKTAVEYDQQITASGLGYGNTDLFLTYAVRIAAKDTGVYALYIDGAFIKDYHTIAGAKRGVLDWTQKDLAARQEADKKPETPRPAKKAPRRKAPKAARENGGWTYNRLGTRQIKACKW